MSAREDAIKHTPRASDRITLLILATLAGVALGITFALVDAPASLPLFQARAPWTGDAPDAREWPESPRAGESAAIADGPGGRELRLLAPRAPRARRLATGLASRRSAAVVALANARTTLAARWRERLQPAPLPQFSPAAACASLLLADATRRTDLAAALPAPYANGSAPPRPAPPDAAVARAESGLAAAVLAADPEACRRALLELAGAEDARFARGVPAPGAPAPERGAAWRLAQQTRADSLTALAARTLEGQTPPQRELAAAGAPERLVLLADALADPYAPLTANAPPPPVTVEPLPGPWGALLGLGAGLGGFAALFAALLGLWLRRGTAAGVAVYEPSRDPSAPLPWLHVVAGPSPASAVRAALELAAHALARRERVLLVDAGGVRLHERLGREARWGLMECMRGDMPVLGLVQYAGRPGFYLLTRGHTGRAAAWTGLGRCLEDARSHFGRVVLVIDRSTPREFGDALAGRPIEGWWGEPLERLPRAAIELSASLGIAFCGIDLAPVANVSLEDLSERVEALAARLLVPVAPRPIEVVEPEPLPVPAVPAESIVLDCDLQVRQRLRFLAWMRRLQSESRQAAARSAPR